MQAPRQDHATGRLHEGTGRLDEPVVRGAGGLTPAQRTSAAVPGGPLDAQPGQGWRALGESLARRRQDLGLSLAQAEADTKVRADYLRAIEAGRPGELPGETYARGFVRLYAGLLGLDGREMMRRHGVSRPAPPPQEVPDQPAPRLEWLPWGVITAAVVLGGILLLLHA